MKITEKQIGFLDDLFSKKNADIFTKKIFSKDYELRDKWLILYRRFNRYRFKDLISANEANKLIKLFMANNLAETFVENLDQILKSIWDKKPKLYKKYKNKKHSI